MMFVERFQEGKWQRIAGGKVEPLSKKQFRVCIPYDVPMSRDIHRYNSLKLRLSGKHETTNVTGIAIDDVRIVLAVKLDARE